MIRPCLISPHRVLACALLVLSLSVLPDIAFAQGSPFATGAESLRVEILAIATPIAIIAVMALGFAAMVGRLSWGAAGLCILGVAIIFGATTLVPWIQTAFGV